MVTIARSIGSVESVEEVRQMLGRDTFAGVGDGGLNPAVDAPTTQSHVAALWGMTQRIVKEVAEHLPDPVGVDPDPDPVNGAQIGEQKHAPGGVRR